MVMLMTTASLLWDHSVAQTSTYEELQAAYIYNFAKYIKWPVEHKTFVIGVYGASDLTESLKKILKDKKVWGADMEVRELAPKTNFLECQLIFIPLSNSREIATILPGIKGRNVLIVTEEDLIKRGAAISFISENNRLRFKINTTELAQAGLTASEGLLKLAILFQ